MKLLITQLSPSSCNFLPLAFKYWSQQPVMLEDTRNGTKAICGNQNHSMTLLRQRRKFHHFTMIFSTIYLHVVTLSYDFYFQLHSFISYNKDLKQETTALTVWKTSYSSPVVHMVKV